MGQVKDIWIPRHRITAEAYHRMGKAGVFAPEAKVELINGEIIDMAPIGSGHAGCVTMLAKWFGQAVGDTAIVYVQNPIRLNTDSEPQPDIALLRPREDFYSDALPTPDDVLLIAEVADSSLEYDRNIKTPLYAQAGIPEFWLIDLEHRVLVIHRDPRGDLYGSVQTLDAPGRIQLSGMPSFSVDMSRLFAARR